ncbi:MAG: transcriptional repressor [Candidatus Nanosynbacter sp.]|uniref:transcriptional repressor n=1 Tax=Candidatus Nanosynsacchari sp. TM7_ANC_38.39_G1_1 TaxID=1986206 RepID=UPI0013EAD835|nr:transcriptional repressor [Candidatus Saccharibacteria bacterium]MBF1031122.1 transcriptional repressor [Candidatus Nanosynbacter sp.]
MTQIVSRRITKYTDSILSILCQLQHATNAEIASRLRELYSNVSDTTVHRITQRLQSDGVIGLAPASRQGCLRYDFSPESHDHFICSECDSLQDIKVPDSVRCQIERQLDGCCFDGPLVITGVCQQCKNRRRNYGIN